MENLVEEEQLIPENLLKKLPKLKASHRSNPLARVKLYLPDTEFEWYITEYDGADICYGLVSLITIYKGRFSLTELKAMESLSSRATLKRDENFSPTRLNAVHDDLYRRHTERMSRPLTPT